MNPFACGILLIRGSSGSFLQGTHKTRCSMDVFHGHTMFSWIFSVRYKNLYNTNIQAALLNSIYASLHHWTGREQSDSLDHLDGQCYKTIDSCF